MSNCPEINQDSKTPVKDGKKLKWHQDDDKLLIDLASSCANESKKWHIISGHFPQRSAAECRHRFRTIQPGIVKGSWTEEEDQTLWSLVQVHGKKWSVIAQEMQSRSGKQVRERFLNKLDPSLNKKKFSQEEDRKIVKLHSLYGPLWSKIARHFPNRSVDIVKNRFYSVLKNKFSHNVNTLFNELKQESRKSVKTKPRTKLFKQNEFYDDKKSSKEEDLDDGQESPEILKINNKHCDTVNDSFPKLENFDSLISVVNNKMVDLLKLNYKGKDLSSNLTYFEKLLVDFIDYKNVFRLEENFVSDIDYYK